MKAFTHHITWYTFKKIRKPNLNETRKAKLQPRANQRYKAAMHNKRKHPRTQERRGENAYQ